MAEAALKALMEDLEKNKSNVRKKIKCVVVGITETNSKAFMDFTAPFKTDREQIKHIEMVYLKGADLRQTGGLTFLEMLEKNDTIKGLVIDKCWMDENTLERIKKILCTNKTLTRLTLELCPLMIIEKRPDFKIGDIADSFNPLLKSLAKNTSLTAVTLMSSSLSSV